MAVGQKRLGLQEEALVRAMGPLGGGIGATGATCGALTGGAAVLGRAFGKRAPEDTDDPRMWKASHEYARRFEAEVAAPFGSVNCRDIAGVDWRDREATRVFYEGEKGRLCAAHTGKAARILGEILEKYLDPKAGNR